MKSREHARSPQDDRRGLEIESTQLIAAIARVARDINIAEELAQDTLVAGLERSGAVTGAVQFPARYIY